jgi:hypothetical protein
MKRLDSMVDTVIPHYSRQATNIRNELSVARIANYIREYNITKIITMAGARISCKCINYYTKRTISF